MLLLLLLRFLTLKAVPLLHFPRCFPFAHCQYYRCAFCCFYAVFCLDASSFVMLYCFQQGCSFVRLCQTKETEHHDTKFVCIEATSEHGSTTLVSLKKESKVSWQLYQTKY